MRSSTNNSIDKRSFSADNYSVFTLINSWCLITANFTTVPVTVTLNALVIICVNRTARLRSRNSNVLLACLAVTDFFVGAVLQPLFIGSRASSKIKDSHANLIDFISYSLMIFLTFSSILHLDVIAVERYISIFHALRYDSIVTTTKLQLAIIGAWLFAVFILVFVIVVKKFANIFSLCIVCLLCCLFIICYCYLSLYRESLRHKRIIHAQLGPEENTSRKREFKATRTTALIVGSVLLTFGVFMLGGAVLFAIKASLFIFLNCLPWLCFVVSLNSLFNPLIYFWRSLELRQAAKELLRNR